MPKIERLTRKQAQLAAYAMVLGGYRISDPLGDLTGHISELTPEFIKRAAVALDEDQSLEVYSEDDESSSAEEERSE